MYVRACRQKITLTKSNSNAAQARKTLEDVLILSVFPLALIGRPYFERHLFVLFDTYIYSAAGGRRQLSGYLNMRYQEHAYLPRRRRFRILSSASRCLLPSLAVWVPFLSCFSVSDSQHVTTSPSRRERARSGLGAESRLPAARSHAALIFVSVFFFDSLVVLFRSRPGTKRSAIAVSELCRCVRSDQYAAGIDCAAVL